MFRRVIRTTAFFTTIVLAAPGALADRGGHDARQGGRHFAPPHFQHHQAGRGKHYGHRAQWRHGPRSWAAKQWRHERRYWRGRWYHGPAPHRFWHRGTWYWGPGFIGGVVLGTALGGLETGWEDDEPERHPGAGNDERIDSCYRVERLSNGRERRVELPIRECRR